MALATTNHATARVTVLGKTGSGKSSLCNAILGRELQDVGVVPTTREAARLTWDCLPHRACLVDTPGLQDAGRAAHISEQLLEFAAAAHVVLWVVGFPDRALAADVEQIRRLRKSQGEVPIIVAASGLDRVSRSFSPWSFDPDTAKTDAERKVRKWLGEVSRTLVEAGAREVIGCAAGESGTDEAAQYNLESLDRALKGFFPAVRREGAENVSTEDEQSRRRPS